MTFEERIKMYKGKKLFIDHVSKVFEDPALCSNVKKVEYEVLTKEIDADTTAYYEFVIVTFTSGAKSIRTVSGTSVNGIFREIGKLIDGGYYDEVRYYESLLTEKCFKQVDLVDEEAYLNLYAVRFDIDGQNMDETFTDKDKAISYADNNKDCLPVVYLIDAVTGYETEYYVPEDEEE